MVNGIDIFREHFNHFKEQYTVIGGFACDLLMNDAGLDFRQTVDIDMVLIVEALTTDFAKAFWAFIEAGGYQARQRSNGQPEFYRFVDPTNPAYPKMIELFSRPQSNVVLQPDTHLMPLHIDDEVSSLSAILLNDDYYHFLLDGRTVTDGDIKKHRLDVFRLFQLVRENQRIPVPQSIMEDITRFIAQMRQEDIRLTDIGIRRSKDSILDIYSQMYITE